MRNIKLKDVPKFKTELYFLANLTKIKDLECLYSAISKFGDLTKPEIALFFKIRSNILLSSFAQKELQNKMVAIV